MDTNTTNQLSQVLIEDLKRTDHLVYVDTALNLTDQVDKILKNPDGQKFDQEAVHRRSTQIAEKAYGFLKKLHVPYDSSFSHDQYRRHLKLKTQIVDERLAKELSKNEKRLIQAVKPGSDASRGLEPVVIAGVAFYLDHENQLVIPVAPGPLPPSDLPSAQMPASKASLSKKTSLMSSVETTPSRTPKKRSNRSIKAVSPGFAMTPIPKISADVSPATAKSKNGSPFKVSFNIPKKF